MLRSLPAFLFAAVLGCAAPAPPETVSLVPADELASVAPDSVQQYQLVGRAVYRGYFGDSTGPRYGVQTVALTYEVGAAQLAINLTSTEDEARYIDLITQAAARPAPDSLVEADTLFSRLRGDGWGLYRVRFGWLVAGHGRAAEVKSMVNADRVREALTLLDLERLAALEAEPVEVDSSFTRVAE